MVCAGLWLQNQERLQVLQRQVALRKQRCSEGCRQVCFSPAALSCCSWAQWRGCRQAWEAAQPSEQGCWQPHLTALLLDIAQICTAEEQSLGCKHFSALGPFQPESCCQPQVLLSSKAAHSAASLSGESRAFHRVLVPREGMKVTEGNVADSSTDVSCGEPGGFKHLPASDRAFKLGAKPLFSVFAEVGRCLRKGLMPPQRQTEGWHRLDRRASAPQPQQPAPGRSLQQAQLRPALASWLPALTTSVQSCNPEWPPCLCEAKNTQEQGCIPAVQGGRSTVSSCQGMFLWGGTGG